MEPLRAAGRLAGAQARLAVGVAAGFDLPLACRAVRSSGAEPRVEDVEIGGVPATVYLPGRGSGPWPAVLALPGVTRQGRRHPAFAGVGRALAVGGSLAVVAEPAGLSSGELTPTAVSEVSAVASAVAARADARHGRVGLVGVSGGASLALLAAADPVLAPRVSAVTALAPCCDVREAMRVVTTNVVREKAALVPFAPGDFFRLAIARSLVACLPDAPDRGGLQGHLRSLDDYVADPLDGLHTWPRAGLGPEARALVELLANGDPRRFDDLYAALSDRLRTAVELLSPVLVAGRILAPVEVVVAREDKYIPRADAVAFVSRCPSVRLTVLSSLSHAVPRLDLRAMGDLARLDGVLVRSLAAIRTPSYSLR